jgi:hypothetical protein
LIVKKEKTRFREADMVMMLHHQRKKIDHRSPLFWFSLTPNLQLLYRMYYAARGEKGVENPFSTGT